jgi:hypothetical protein
MYGRSTPPRRSSDTSNPSSAVLTAVMSGFLPTTSCRRIAAFVAYLAERPDFLGAIRHRRKK